MEKEAGPSKYFFWALLSVVGLASLIVILPVLTSIITGAMLAFIFYPLYDWVKRHVRYKAIAAFFIAILIIVLITIPTALIINSLAQETQYVYLRLKQQLVSGALIDSHCFENTLLCKTLNNFNALLRDDKVRTYLINLLNEVLSFITKKTSDIIISIPQLVLSLMVTLFTTFYLLKEGKGYVDRVKLVIPLKVHHQEQVINQFGDVTYALIYGGFVVSLAQGLLGALGFWLFGLSGAMWWGILIFLFSFVPFVGTAMVWLPASGFLVISGYLNAEPSTVGRGVGLFLFGLFLISTIDNILKPFIVAERARVHPLLILVGGLGGLFVFGAIGLLIGPFILVLFQTLLEIYERERAPHAHEEGCILGDGHNGGHVYAERVQQKKKRSRSR